MKKHLFGLAIFSFIVFAAAFVYGIFFSCSEELPVSKPVLIEQNAPLDLPTTTNCKLKKASYGSIKVKQAVFDWKAKRFYWQIDMAEVKEPIELLFFTKSSQDVQFVNGALVGNVVSSDGVMRFSSSYDWQNKINSFENLYVIARPISEMENYSENYQVYGNKFQPKFDAAKATPVTIDYGK